LSANPLDGVIVPENIIRDFLNTQAGIAVNFNLDLPSTGNALGLDLYIRNRGAAAITINVNGTGAITVDPGDVYTLNNFQFWLVQVIAAVVYDLQIFGVRITTLKRRGLL